MMMHHRSHCMVQDSLVFDLGWWIVIDSNHNLYITYDPETDEIISISADEPDSE